MEDGQMLGVGAGNRADRTEFADAVRGADGPDAANAGISVGRIGGAELVAGATQLMSGCATMASSTGNAKSPGTPKMSVTPMSLSRPRTYSMTVGVVGMETSSGQKWLVPLSI
jgi:hypothetical protein